MAREQLNSAAYNWHAFAGRQDLAAALAGHVAGRLTNAIAERGTGLLAVSGGTTPARFFASLSNIPIAWNKVTVTLVDERCVPASSPRSNAGLVAANLLQNAAAAARFVPLYEEAATIEDASESDSRMLRSLPWPLDVVVLGMGTDGHTASFFPDADDLAKLLDPSSTRIVLPVHATSAGEPRLTLALARLVEAGFIALHIEGEDKRKAFESAMASATRKPIRAVLDAAERPVEVFWAP
ncbi:MULTISPECIES: 6-phosphogluconolactonase [unclassified Mesorhizobium]|uniref:6-phosphogluconolactonase n=1 Tax=unclassified Mesorhizobium TaxID=325217 RepID=UPI000FD25E32|nr:MULTISPECIES: 6-phosphogluconolactonase [unclassified Mesorhizobium]RVB76316.1 6-phosphogluconolactonase [Mesorhizobium sp. M6A.T.Cr.TU.014.01.1.1]RWP79725.1 MAG: 6-phosphogluconolactonase [Mesorhizobium sp.]RWQ04399.1 MAG: 6-phosphogluconolactonase [Mesorhizobium sp.]RWQ04743.1 MAG: 6-phosphogluconolactonase [Mesorhizobium sp.]